MTPRAEVLAFAHLMEARLQANDHKGGWIQCPLPWLGARTVAECGELVLVLAAGHDAETIMNECADVANFAMMTADVAWRETNKASASLRAPAGRPKGL